MTLTITEPITVRLHEDDRRLLEEMLAAIKAQPNPMTGIAASPAPAPAPAAPAAPAPAAPAAPTVTMQALQALVQELAAPQTGKFAAVKALINQYADRVSKIAPEKWQECYERLLVIKEAE